MIFQTEAETKTYFSVRLSMRLFSSVEAAGCQLSNQKVCQTHANYSELTAEQSHLNF